MWEGKMITQSINPYAIAPADPSLVHLRDDVWKGVNHADMTACYPPGILYLFSKIAQLHYGTGSFKAVFVFFDLATLIVLFALLRLKGEKERMAVLYALNPVVLVSFAGQAHLDSIMLFFMTAALLAYYSRRWILMFMLIALSIQAKQISILILPFLLKRENIRYSWICALGVLLPFLPFIESDIRAPFTSLMTFGMSMAHNGSLHGILRFLIGSITPATIVCMVAFIIMYSRAFFFKDRDPMHLVFYSLCALILLSPTVHFWYISWIIPFLCFSPRWSWSVLCLTIAFYFIADMMYLKSGVWHQPPAIQVMQWLPIMAAHVYTLTL